MSATSEDVLVGDANIPSNRQSLPENSATTITEEAAKPHTMRRRLPDERRALTHHFSIAGQEGYVTVGVYEDGQPGEIFITMSKEGSTISGLMDAFATVVSLALQQWRAARRNLQQAQLHAIRAQRLDRQSQARVRQFRH